MMAGSEPKPSANELDGEATTMDNLVDLDDGVTPFSVSVRRSSASAHCTGYAETRVPLSVMSAIEISAGNAWTTLAPIRGVAAAESLRKVRRVGRLGIEMRVLSRFRDGAGCMHKPS